MFGLNAGWEHPLWFAAGGEPREETAGFERQNWWEPVGREARMLRERAGILDISTYSRTRVTGPGARDWLDRLLAGRVPAQPGRTSLAPLIGARGGVAGDFTVACLGEGDFLMIGSGMAERFHHRLFAQVPLPEGTAWRSVTEAMAGFNVAGPRARDLLGRLTDADLSTAGFPFLRSARIDVAGVPCVALRVSFTGDLGWELHCAEGDQARLLDALLAAGRDLGAGPVGSRALASLRIEKGYPSWGRDLSPETWPHECGLGGLVRGDKPFLNRAAWEAVAESPPREVLRCLAVEAGEADASGGEPVFEPGGAPAGRVSSGAYGYHVGRSLALAYLRPDLAPGAALEVMILGRPHPAVLLERPAFDPEGLRLRA